MLTWEDGYYDYSRSFADACSGGNVRSDKGGNPLDQGGSGDLEGQIGLAVARMSYYVYSMGEGIIGRVAFTGKHQWVFHDGQNRSEAASGGNLHNQSASEKNPDGWQNQFAAGIKTIAVIAVPQGVVQLGSTKLIMEDLKWIDHVKSVFSALQTAPSTPRPESALDGQGGRSLYSNKLPPFSGSNTFTTLRKPVAAQQSQSSLRNAEDAAHWQKLGAQASPAVVSKLQGFPPIAGSPGALCRERLFQQGAKARVEPQGVSYPPSAVIGPQTPQVHVNPPQFDVPSNSNKSMLPCNNMKSRCLEDLRAGNLNVDPTWTSLVAEGISSGLHNDSKRDHVVPTCGSGIVDRKFSPPQENYSFKKKFSMCRTPETQVEGGFSSGSFRAGQQQQLNTNDTAIKSADFSSLPSRIVGEEYFHNQVYPAAVNVASHSSAKSFGAASKDDVQGVTLRREALNKPESHREPNLHKYGGQSDVNTLDELEKFLASFSKEETGSRDTSFAIGDELSQALGPAFWKGAMDELSGGQKAEELVLNQVEKASVLPIEMGTDWGSKFARSNSYERLTAVSPLESKPEPLLDAIVGVATSNLHLVSSNTDASFSVKVPLSNLTCAVPTLSVTQETEPACSSSLSGKILPSAPHHEIRYQENSTGVLRNLQNFCAPSDTQTNVSVHSWTEEGQSFKSDDTLRLLSQSKRSDELSKSSKKRSRSGESARPRPKDRQQIQDRVRELRDIVPNGSKCSIDALLEKTIKHMLFLHSVTLHADQLKNTGELKEDPDSGATWALDIGSQEKRYPIVVKDLNQPRQMLVEMMCEESGLFLETADVIRNLGLTILRGSLESHEDKYWAKFIVEANRDIQRVDVLVSLIQRLHLDNNSSSSSMTVASQSTAVKPQLGVESSNSYTVSGKR